MYTIIAGLLLFVILSGFTIATKKRLFGGRYDCVVNLIDLAMISLAVTSFALVVCKTMIPRKIVTTTYELSAMSTVNSAQGSFVLGTGNFGSSLTYHVYVKNANGSVSPRQISELDNVEITQKPELKDIGYWKRTVRTLDYSTPLAHWVVQIDAETLLRNELEVPVGTVLNNFAAQ